MNALIGKEEERAFWANMSLAKSENNRLSGGRKGAEGRRGGYPLLPLVGSSPAQGRAHHHHQ